MRWRPDAIYYRQLAAGAEYLADKAADPGERAEHLKMAARYRRRAEDSAGPAGRAAATVH
jgi:hypothetical protein